MIHFSRLKTIKKPVISNRLLLTIGGTTGYNSNPLELHSSRNTDNSRKKVSYKALFLENLITVGLQRCYII